MLNAKPVKEKALNRQTDLTTKSAKNAKNHLERGCVEDQPQHSRAR